MLANHQPSTLNFLRNLGSLSALNGEEGTGPKATNTGPGVPGRRKYPKHLKFMKSTQLIIAAITLLESTLAAQCQGSYLVDAKGEPVVRTGTNNAYLGHWPSLARFTVCGAGETGAPSDAGNKDATILVSTTAGGTEDGGGYAVGFGHGSYAQSYFGEMKGLGTSGSFNTLGDLGFFLRRLPTDTVLTEVMRIVSSGRVGINNSAPTVALDVVGNVRASHHFILPAGDGYEWRVGAFTDWESWQLTRRNSGNSAWVNALTVDTACNVGVGLTTPQAKLDVLGDVRASGKVTCHVLELTSDRAVKGGVQRVDAQKVLGKLVGLAISTWHYTNSPTVDHLGPMAQDFQAAFGVGESDKHIGVIDGLAALYKLEGGKCMGRPVEWGWDRFSDCMT